MERSVFKEQDKAPSGKRPLALRTIAGITALQSAGLLLLQAIVPGSFGELAETLEISKFALFLETGLMSGIGVIGGSLLWMEERWGWILVAFYWAVRALSFVSILVAVVKIALSPEESALSIQTIVTNVFSDLGTGLLSLFFLFRTEMLERFGYPPERRVSLIVKVAGAVLALYALYEITAVL